MANKLPRDFFFAAIIFAVFITGIVSLVNLVKDGESGNVETAVPGLMGQENVSKFNEVFDNNVTGKVADVKLKMGELNPDDTWGAIDAITLPIALIKTAWASVQLIFSSFGFMDGAIGGLKTILGVPGWVVGFILTAIIAFFVFSMLSLIFGKDT